MPTDYGQRTAGQRAWLGGALVVVAVLAIGGGLLAWRGLASRTPSLQESTSGPSQMPDVAGFETLDLVNGIPWGFPLTPRGAASAAVSAVASSGQAAAVFDAERFVEVAAVLFEQAEALRQAEQVTLARTEFELSGWAAQPPSRRMYFLTPLAVRLVSFDAARSLAEVEVWAMTLVGVGDAGGAVFTTSTVHLQPRPGTSTWMVTGLDSVEGPTPMVAAPASAPGRTRAFVREALPTVPLPLGPKP